MVQKILRMASNFIFPYLLLNRIICLPFVVLLLNERRTIFIKPAREAWQRFYSFQDQIYEMAEQAPTGKEKQPERKMEG